MEERKVSIAAGMAKQATALSCKMQEGIQKTADPKPSNQCHQGALVFKHQSKVFVCKATKSLQNLWLKFLIPSYKGAPCLLIFPPKFFKNQTMHVKNKVEYQFIHFPSIEIFKLKNVYSKCWCCPDSTRVKLRGESESGITLSLMIFNDHPWQEVL